MATTTLPRYALRRQLSLPSRTRVAHIPSHISQQQRRRVSAYGYEQAKALTFRDYGEPSDVLSLHSHSISPAHSNLLTLRFLASPINPADINQIQGLYPSKPTFTTSLGTPYPLAVAGNEAVAQVLSTGSAVSALSKGDWVIMNRPSLGTWRTHAQLPESAVLKIDNHEHLSPIQVGTVSVNPCTAYRLLRDFVPLTPGDWFIQNGANSGVGRAAIQLARAWGYRSINVVRARPDDPAATDALRADLTSLGADIVVTDAELQARDFRDRVAEWTHAGREPLKLALNCVGGKPALALAKQLAPHGCMVTYGAMGRKPLEVPASLLIFRDIRFAGFWVSEWAARHPGEKKKTVEHVLNLMREGGFRDAPVERVEWGWETKGEELVRRVEGTLEGFRSGKGVFVFGEE
ncbi:NAD(P)-binding protein [Pseudovirgaria hyperparasitica]|uniref:enoyl-[acyl-carrier-protein] reductase n=1 Tax=Pseudovirgaria hyperparasitica TaxID=470096 RepID=A0A6A6WEK1_9PEZI|nr:NAD(P)-binding protein [Pseudovirgaria hyperparasitica]KAF2760965.1 NAD(P)-binding protein [Pseudovirgaria hyperparasitica]